MKVARQVCIKLVVKPSPICHKMLIILILLKTNRSYSDQDTLINIIVGSILENMRYLFGSKIACLFILQSFDKGKTMAIK